MGNQINSFLITEGLIISVSVANMLIPLWLGLTLLLNSDQRRAGIWIASGGLIFAGLFFAGHTLVLTERIFQIFNNFHIWWLLSWTLLTLLPLAWYLLITWYTSHWQSSGKTIHRLLTGVTLFQLFILYCLILSIGEITIFNASGSYDIAISMQSAPVKLITFLYPLYIVSCTLFSLHALLFPGPPRRLFGESARTRAKPWLLACSVIMLLISLIVSFLMLWLAFSYSDYNPYRDFNFLKMVVYISDLVIEVLILIAVIMLGQAIISYEVFAGKTLPRKGLFHNWLFTIIFSLFYGLIFGFGVSSGVSSHFLIIFCTLTIPVFFAFFTWRFFQEREHFIKNLRPFVSNEKLYENIMKQDDHARNLNIRNIFAALCRDVLEAKNAALLPLGALIPFADNTLVYPETCSHTLPEIESILRLVKTPENICIPLNDPEKNWALAVPLWNERGAAGIFILGKKAGGGLYTQEEIEICRASGERLIDLIYSSEILHWIVKVQRKKLKENLVLDRSVHRILHDDVLPLIHTAMLEINGSSRENETVRSLGTIHSRISALLHEMPSAPPDIDKVGLLGALRNVAESELRNSFDGVKWEISESAESIIKQLPELITEVLYFAAREALRNAAKYGRPELPMELFTVSISVNVGKGLEIIIEDNGKGLTGLERSKGSGRGLALHSTMMAVIGGYLNFESTPGQFTRVSLVLPEQSFE